ncbi:divergent PAP2 family protein [Candidatus Woesearchaeota archaeon]|nr:divergent PAP2 family protein [Candidatus Woesearchaeota archaeon]
MAQELLMNPIFLSVLISGCVAQALKMIILIGKNCHHLSWHYLFVTGGMPSTHSALVTSLVLSIYLYEGTSTVFFVSTILAVIVLRDAVGVRRTAGEEGKAINKIIRTTKMHMHKIHYSLGHTPAEVAVGVLIGIVTSFIVPLFTTTVSTTFSIG